MVSCHDCGLDYDDPGWIEAIVPDDIWEIITPADCREGGILCITCISRRCAEAGLTDVPVLLCGTEPLRAVTSNRALYKNDTLSHRLWRIRNYWKMP